MLLFQNIKPTVWAILLCLPVPGCVVSSSDDTPDADAQGSTPQLVFEVEQGRSCIDDANDNVPDHGGALQFALTIDNLGANPVQVTITDVELVRDDGNMPGPDTGNVTSPWIVPWSPEAAPATVAGGAKETIDYAFLAYGEFPFGMLDCSADFVESGQIIATVHVDGVPTTVMGPLVHRCMYNSGESCSAWVSTP